METVNERKQIKVSMTFRDEDGVLYTPTKVTYELIDVKSGSVIISKTEVVPTSSTVIVTITAIQNSSVDSDAPYETKLFSFEWYAGATLLGSEDYYYKVKNLVRIPIA